MKFNDSLTLCRPFTFSIVFPDSVLESIMEEDYNQILNFDEEMTLSDDDRESSESLFRRVISENGGEESAGEDNPRSRSPIRGPKSDARVSAPTPLKGRGMEPIETIIGVKTRY